MNTIEPLSQRWNRYLSEFIPKIDILRCSRSNTRPIKGQVLIFNIVF